MLLRSLSFLLVLVTLVPCAWGQAHGELDINSVRARFYANGRISSDTLDGSSNMEVPQGGGTQALYSAGPWVAGLDSIGSLHSSSILYDVGGSMQFFPGPLTLSDGTITQDVSDAYNHVWSVTREEIATHLAYFTCLNDPDCSVEIEFPDGYTIPASILDWPAMGNVDAGYDAYLAPFYDLDLDGEYDPSSGDVPCILGDQALFLVFNDRLISGTSRPVGVEVHAMPFAYGGADPILSNTVFIRYHIINRSGTNYDSTFIGFFNDFDLGCPNDDLVGSDPSRNMCYVYNGDDNDENCLGNTGYGAQPPAFGMVLLKGPLVDAEGTDEGTSNTLPNWNGQGFGDGTVDNERHGLSNFISFTREGDPCCTDPAIPMQHHRYLQSVWKDGVHLSYGGTGHSTDPEALICEYMYPGDGDPVGAGTDGVVQVPWSEAVPSPASPDRRALMSTGQTVLEPGEHIDLLFAYVYARAQPGGTAASLAVLQARVDSLRIFANTLPIWDVPEEVGFVGQCADYALLSVQERALGALLLAPTPATDEVRFRAPKELVGGLLVVRDAMGRSLAQQRVVPEMNTIDVSRYANGVYTCDVISRNARYVGRLVKQ